jgi:hypothetical protein
MIMIPQIHFLFRRSNFESGLVDRVRLLGMTREKVSGVVVDAANISVFRGFAEASMEMLESCVYFFELGKYNTGSR